MQLYSHDGRPTGPGKFVQRIEDKRYIFDNYWLYNFNVDGNTLKPEHKQVLLRHVIPTLRRIPSHAKIFGYASRTGTPHKNQQLSAGRVLHVKQYLLSFGFSEAQVPGQEMRAAGSAFGNPGISEDEFYRAVHVLVVAGKKNRPLPPDIQMVDDPITAEENQAYEFGDDHIREKRPGSSRWAIKYLDGRSVGAGAGKFGVGAGVQVTHHRFVLYNLETDEVHVATFDGLGGGVGANAPTPAWAPVSGSVTLAGDQWHRFTTPRRVEFKDFKGEAFWYEGPQFTSSYVTFQQAGVKVAVPTGFTIGLPAAAGNYGKVKVTRPITGIQDRP